MDSAKKPRLEWNAFTAFLVRPSRYNRGTGGEFFARIKAPDHTLAYWRVTTNDFDTTGKELPTYEDARRYILALYALID